MLEFAPSRQRYPVDLFNFRFSTQQNILAQKKRSLHSLRSVEWTVLYPAPLTPQKIFWYIYTRDYDSPDLYRCLCIFSHLHRIHLCTFSYRILGCCCKQHYHYSCVLCWHTRLYLEQQQSNSKTFNWNGVVTKLFVSVICYYYIASRTSHIK